MLSMVEVKCPHCNVRGQIMLPPLGAIIVGPCPNCDELVVVFCGRVLPLNKETMVNGSSTEKHEHLKSVLVDFMDDRIRKVVDQLTPEVTEGLHDYTPENDDYTPNMDEQPATTAIIDESKAISDNELDKFLRFDLPRIDNKDYFRAVFE
ncbi:MAG: hypothetical protein IT366_23900 [Candidatus Hydrogenedentes bacterium]|nr:hypothetical protein [Candidatus Hydrogenedentota bacterium]